MGMLRSLNRMVNGIKAFRVKFYSTSSILKSAYDSDGKTTVTMLNQEPGLGIMIDTFSQVGFKMNNGVFVVGPVIIFPKTILSWNIEGDREINEESLVLFPLLEPKIDLLIIGYGNSMSDRRNFDRIMLNLRNKRKLLNVEILPTDKAVATYNFIVSEGRFVGAALVPPVNVTSSDDEIAAATLRRKIYTDEN